MYTESSMSKQKKKRSKKYTGADAAVTRPSITRVKAVRRTRLQQWWLDRRRALKPALIAAAVISAFIWLITEIIRLASGSF